MYGPLLFRVYGPSQKIAIREVGQGSVWGLGDEVR